MSYLDDERGKNIILNGTPMPDRKGLAFVAPGATGTDSEASKRTTIDFTGLSLPQYDSMSDLRVENPEDGRTVFSRGYASPNDGGGGVWLGVTGAAPGTYTHNGGTVIVPSGGDGSAAWVRQFSGPMFVDWFGADSTGASDSTAGLIACQNAAFANSIDYQDNLPIAFSGGDYLFTQDNPFGQWDSALGARRDVFVYGNGSTIILRPGASTATHFYNCETSGGGAGTDQQLLFATFSDLYFDFDDAGSTAGAEINFMRWYPKSGAPAQSLRFSNCVISGGNAPTYGGSCFIVRGLINASECAFHECKFLGVQHVLDVDNTNSVNWRFFGCEAEGNRNHVLQFVEGGALTWVGGSIIHDAANVAPTYILHVDPTAGNLTNFNFIGVKTEMNAATGRICYIGDTLNSAIVNFDGCSFSTTSGGDRDSISVLSDTAASVMFRNCQLGGGSGEHLTVFRAPSVSSFWVTGTDYARVTFENCRVPSDVHTNVTYESGALGLFKVSGGTVRGASISTATPGIALDYETTGMGFVNPKSTVARSRKTHTVAARSWPVDVVDFDDGGYAQMQLPPDAMLLSLRVKKAATGGNVTPWQIAAVNNDGSHVYGISTAAQMKDEHLIEASDLWRDLDDSNEQVIRVASTTHVAYSGLAGTFSIGEQVSDDITGATAQVVADSGATLTVVMVVGTFTTSNGITGTASGATATIGTVTSYRGDVSGVGQVAADMFLAEYY